MYRKFFSACLALAFSATLLSAQSSSIGGSANVDDQVASLTKSWEDAYNKADVMALRKLMAADIQRTNADGTALSGPDAVSDYYAKMFQSGKWKVMIRHESSAVQADGSIVATGSYKAEGTAADGTTSVNRGTYRNEIVRQDRSLVIRKMKLHDSL